MNKTVFTLVLMLGLFSCRNEATPALSPLTSPENAQALNKPAAEANDTTNAGPQSGDANSVLPEPKLTPTVPREIFPEAPPEESEFKLPPNLDRIRFGSIDRFLDGAGESTRLIVELLDKDGQLIDTVLPLEWSLERPQDFSIDAQGTIKALVDNGFSTVIVKVKGTSLEARTVMNVSQGSGGGGGGSASVARLNQPPVITLLQANNNTVNGAGALVKLNVNATDPDDTLSQNQFSWSCVQDNCGQFNTAQGKEVFWRSPATGGVYTLTLSVSDGKSTVSQNLEITVTVGQGNIQVN